MLSGITIKEFPAMALIWAKSAIINFSLIFDADNLLSLWGNIYKVEINPEHNNC